MFLVTSTGVCEIHLPLPLKTGLSLCHKFIIIWDKAVQASLYLITLSAMKKHQKVQSTALSISGHETLWNESNLPSLSPPKKKGFAHAPKYCVLLTLPILLHAAVKRSDCPQQIYYKTIINFFLLRHFSKSCEMPARFKYRGADKSLARPTSRWILFDGENISFDASLVLYIYK
jgi:hypothetical protein